MIHDVLTSLEGSASSQRAGELAVALGRRLDATVVGVALIDEPGIREGTAAGVGAFSYKAARDEALLRDAHPHAEGWLDDFAATCRQSNVRARTLEVVGRPAQAIVDQMRVHDLTLIGWDANFRFETSPEDHRTRDFVLHHGPALAALVPGSTTRSLVGSTPVPLYLHH